MLVLSHSHPVSSCPLDCAATIELRGVNSGSSCFWFAAQGRHVDQPNPTLVLLIAIVSTGAGSNLQDLNVSGRCHLRGTCRTFATPGGSTLFVIQPSPFLSPSFPLPFPFLSPSFPLRLPCLPLPRGESLTTSPEFLYFRLCELSGQLPCSEAILAFGAVLVLGWLGWLPGLGDLLGLPEAALGLSTGRELAACRRSQAGAFISLPPL